MKVAMREVAMTTHIPVGRLSQRGDRDRARDRVVRESRRMIGVKTTSARGASYHGAIAGARQFDAAAAVGYAPPREWLATAHGIEALLVWLGVRTKHGCSSDAGRLIQAIKPLAVILFSRLRRTASKNCSVVIHG
jgi:hypothetical protein